MERLAGGHRGTAVKESSRQLVLGGDVGGTHTTLALAWVAGRRVRLAASFRYSTRTLSDLALPLREVAAHARERFGRPVERAALGLAGPLQGKILQLTNAPLQVNPSSLKRRVGLRSLRLINDFAAIGYGINCLPRSDLLEMPPRSAATREDRRATRAIIGAGTGLGKSILIYDDHLSLYIPHPSEGGHVDFPATLPWERDLVDFIRRRHRDRKAVSYEDLLSGRGLERIYQFLREKNIALETPFSRRIDRAREKAPLISRYSRQDETCRETFRLFLEILAKCARNFALDTLALGGIYLAGGILAKNLSHLEPELFRNHFEDNDRHLEILQGIPIRVVTNYDVSLYGAALAATLCGQKR
ncbi:MAG: glucokinase [candidate division NC10 bacterium]|nr:glucokinase [candidate division NC10 bacterium]